MSKEMTIRKWLNEAEFNWERGRIIWGDTGDAPYPGGAMTKQNIEIEHNHPVLDLKFDSDHGGPHCPRFIAYDNVAIYFPAQYDGATWLEKVWRSPKRYLGKTVEKTPYPGG